MRKADLLMQHIGGADGLARNSLHITDGWRSTRDTDSTLLPIDVCVRGDRLLAGAGLARPCCCKARRAITQLIFPAGALGALVLAGCRSVRLGGAANVAVLPLGLPDLPFHLRLDALSAFFLLLLGAASIGISLYSAGYFRHMAGGTLGLLCFEYHLFLAGMALVFLADDAYLFMVAWETMALSSYFLVTTDHNVPEIRRAGFLYLLIAHVGAIAILLCFGVMQGGHGDYTFATMREAHLDAFWASVTFLLALFGFGAKAGILPLHVWLPEAHPAAPSPVSAMMSGIMLKTAIYGMLRVSFDLLDMQLWWWGALALTLGLVTALFGVLFAAVQTDMKRLLAYSSIENIGIILAGIGLAIIFHAFDKDALAALALTAALYHCAQPRLHQEPAVPRHRLGAARHRRAQPGQAGRADPPHARSWRCWCWSARWPSPACRR